MNVHSKEAPEVLTVVNSDSTDFHVGKQIQLGQRVRELRRARGMKGAELARLCHVSRGYIGDIEQGRVSPSLDVLRRIAEALETSVAYLVGEEKDAGWIREFDGLILNLRGPAVDSLTEEERRSIANFVKYIRSQHEIDKN